MPRCWASCPIQGRDGHLARETRSARATRGTGPPTGCRRCAGRVQRPNPQWGTAERKGRCGGRVGHFSNTKAPRAPRRRAASSSARPLPGEAWGLTLMPPGGASQWSADAVSRQRQVRPCTPSPGFQKNRFEPRGAGPPWNPPRGKEVKTQDQKEVLARRKPAPLLRSPPPTRSRKPARTILGLLNHEPPRRTREAAFPPVVQTAPSEGAPL